MQIETKERSIDLIAMDIKSAFAADGYVLSQTNPFFDWIRGKEVNGCRPENSGLSFYIANPPVSPVAPFDLAIVFISFESSEISGIYFQLTFYFHNALLPCIESEEIHKIYDKHDKFWFPKLSEYFTEIEDSFHFSWETEYDESIEDNLSGYLPLEEAGNIALIMNKMEVLFNNWR